MRGIVVLWIVLNLPTLMAAPARSVPGADEAPGPLAAVCLPGGPLLFSDLAPTARRRFRPEVADPAGGGRAGVPEIWQLIQLPGDDPEEFMKPGATMTGMQMAVRLLSSDVECDEEMMPGRSRPTRPRPDCAFDPADDRVLPATCR